MSYNLNDNVNDQQDFSINNIQYILRYPLVEEIETLQEKIDLQNNAEDAVEKKRLGDEMQDYLYSFITPVKKESPSISDTLKKSNIKVLRNFNNMFKSEFGIN